MSISSYQSFASLRSSSRASSRASTSSTASWSSMRSNGSTTSYESLGSSLYSSSTIMSPVQSRSLSSIEKSRAYHNVMNMSTSIAVVAGTYSVPITRDILFPALADLVSSEPMLGANIFGQNKKNLVLKKIESFELEEVVTFDPTESLREFLNTVSRRVELPYDRTDLPLWRLYVLSEYEVAFVFDRGCLDESSGVFFHKKLATNMAFPNKLVLPRPNWTVEASPLSLPDSLTNLFDMKPTKQSFKGLLKMNKPKIAWAGPDIRSSKNTGSTLIFEIPAIFVRRLMANVKHRGVTMTSVFYAALMQCVLEYIPNYVLSQEELELLTTTPVNARPLLRSRIDEEALGNYSLDITHSLENFSSSIRQFVFPEKWAKNFNTYLTSSSSSPESLCRSALSTPSVWNSTEDMKKRVQSMTKKPRQNLLEVNNLGLISMGRRNTHAEVMLNKLTFSQPSTVHNNALGSGFSLNVVALDNGPAVFTLSLACDDKARTRARKIRDSFLNVLSNVLET
ncbi:N-acetyltransferase (predicted) [Sugiyamaella lignohabitans]|uniref:N-acetyltransferase (Predicted) n=1 Tax=Sugiyamaella lignohabitans TaxID=796027 RepID=A0A167DYK7_9ASCO|nr:N-acetyltransferase (predicted) [Sugiyamaella lignohabitans]ANB13446.1 N-acetyltransferase (predicted) [Sugiyamaella lignohabitans]